VAVPSISRFASLEDIVSIESNERKFFNLSNVSNVSNASNVAAGKKELGRT
jgi:hypothetical protein